MMSTRFWAEMTWTDFRAIDMTRTIAVLPVAATEQHGPHLPLGVDTYVMEGYLKRVVARLPPDLPVLFLPVQSCGCSVEHRSFPGTLELSATTVQRAWTEICESVHRTGCRKLVLLNSHGGNVAILDTIAHDLRARLGLFVVLASWHRFGTPDGLFSPEEMAHGIHAGDIETSLMLDFRPDLVRTECTAKFPSFAAEMERDYTWLRAGRPTGFGWMTQDLSPTGAIGNAAAATRQKGETCADYGATAFVELLQDVDAFDLTKLDARPQG
jgi:creatinine amidohydrolase